MLRVLKRLWPSRRILTHAIRPQVPQISQVISRAKQPNPILQVVQRIHPRTKVRRVLRAMIHQRMMTSKVNALRELEAGQAECLTQQSFPPIANHGATEAT